MQNERALKPKGRDKWALIGRAVGTTNALQPFAVESRQRAMYARVHPRDREPGSLGPNWIPRGKDEDEVMADSLATMRSAAATLYASWERCSRFCSDEDLAAHVEKCRSPRASRGSCCSRAGRRPTLLSVSASFSSFDSGACHRSTDDLASCCLVFRGWRDRWALPPPGSSLPTAAVRCGKGGTKRFVVAESTVRVYKRALQKRALCESDRHDCRV